MKLKWRGKLNLVSESMESISVLMCAKQSNVRVGVKHPSFVFHFQIYERTYTHNKHCTHKSHLIGTVYSRPYFALKKHFAISFSVSVFVGGIKTLYLLKADISSVNCIELSTNVLYFSKWNDQFSESLGPASIYLIILEKKSET